MKLLLNILGIILSTMGIIYIISYLNLTTIGYSYIYYVKTIVSKLECLIIIPGIIILFLNNKGE